MTLPLFYSQIASFCRSRLMISYDTTYTRTIYLIIAMFTHYLCYTLFLGRAHNELQILVKLIFDNISMIRRL